MTAIGNNTVIMFSNSQQGTWEFDVDAKTWQEIITNGDEPDVSYGFRFACHDDGKAILCGGYSSSADAAVSLLWEYDAASETWSAIQVSSAVAPSGRTEHSFLYIDNDKCLLLGGSQAGTDMWEYDIPAKTWSLIEYAVTE